MKLTQIAFAVAAILGSVAASAQTANVTLYGRVSTNLETAQYKGTAGSARNNTVENISSRFGFRGSESLGGGMNAIFQLEAGFASDTGTGGGFTRESWVGLEGGFGQLKLGYGLTPYDDVLGWAHHQGANSWENRNNGVSGGAGFAKRDLFTNYTSGANCNSSAFDARYGNSVSYQTPTMGGFVARTQYALIGENGSGSCTGWDTALRYSGGPVRVGVAYALHKKFTGLGTVVAPHDQDSLRGYASFDAGVVMVDATYETSRYKPASGTLKYKYWELGALVPVGALKLGAQYSQRDNGLAQGYNPLTQALTVNAATLANWNNGGGKHLALTGDYALSKRTQFRGYYSQLKNETGTKINALSLGLWHTF